MIHESLSLQMILDNTESLLYISKQEGDSEFVFIEDLKRGITYVEENGEECEMEPIEKSFVTRRHSQFSGKNLKEILNLDGKNYYFIGRVSHKSCGGR